MRLWSSKPSHEFDLKSFNAGDYIAAIEQKERGESISSVLYPNDDTQVGKELRLKQQFFFCSATLQDILHQYKKSAARYNNNVIKAFNESSSNINIDGSAKSPSSIPGLRTLKDIPKRVAIQLNDTHPAIGVPEFMRLLLDEELLCWDDAWNITKSVFCYTNHTIMTEAMEKWPVPMLSELLPRHAEIIFEINHRFLEIVRKKWPGDQIRVRRMSIVEESEPKMFRMANLAVIGSHTVNGVAEMHTNLLKTELFADFCELGDTKFRNVTNGVTPRRWILQANPKLATMYTDLAGPGWVNDMKRLEGLESFCDDAEFCERFRSIKQSNKRRVASFLEEACRLRYKIAPSALFDMQIKRIHEYKRQLLNVLGIIHRFDAILRATPSERFKIVPRVFIIAGKAAPGYDTARLIIQLACAVAKVVNETAECAGLLTVCFVPNFNVSIAELLIPASDISQHISLAGTEASGTGNMKFAMNGGLIVGTRDGANVEIARAIGGENIFQFGATVEEVKSLKKTAPSRNPAPDERLANVCAIIHSGIFGDAKKLGFNRLCSNTLTPQTDSYLCGHDFASYLDAQARADELYLDERLWTRKSVLSALRMAKFSTDRTIKEYADKIWNCEAKAFLPAHVKEKLRRGY
jgi:glycogen phosphorylase